MNPPDHYLVSGSAAGSYLRLIDSCITQLNAQGPSRTCNESKKEEEDEVAIPPQTLLSYSSRPPAQPRPLHTSSSSSLLLSSLELSDTQVYEP